VAARPARPWRSVDDSLEVVLLAGRLGLDDDGWPLAPLLDRLEHRGVLPRVLCLSRGGSSGQDPRFLEFPTLGNRWLRAFVVRRLRLETGIEHPRLLHAVHDEMAEAALALADDWQLPYLQTVDDFGVVQRGVRLSRRWFRGLVATSQDLADELVGGLGIPADRISVIAPGISLPPSPPRPCEWKVPVIGTAGPPVEASGFACFLEAARLVLGSGRDAEFLVATRGHDAIDLRRHAQSLEISDRVSVADFPVSGDQFWGVLDIYCQPSLVPSTGRTLALALARGIPSIATGVEGLHTLIDHGRTGMIVPADSPAALASAITGILDDPREAQLAGQRGQADIRARFDLDLEADLLARLYRDQACAPPPPHAPGS
jgi:glycosyltransferase involved in cell wall biosynthesis